MTLLKRAGVAARYVSFFQPLHYSILYSNTYSAFGLETHVLSPIECYEKWPIMKYDDLEVCLVLAWSIIILRIIHCS